MRCWTVALMMAGLTALSCAHVTVTPSGQATTSGAAIISAPLSPPVLVTPTMRLGTTAPNAVGATNATPGNTAGATNATLSIISPPNTNSITVPLVENPSAAAVQPLEASAVGQSLPAAQTLPLNLGVARMDSSLLEEGPSLAEVTAPLRKGAKVTPGKVYTNEDVQRLSQQNSGGLAGAVASPVNDARPNAPSPPAVGQPANEAPVVIPGTTTEQPKSSTPRAALSTRTLLARTAAPGEAMALPVFGLIGLIGMVIGVFVRRL